MSMPARLRNQCSRGHAYVRRKDLPVCPKCWPGYYKRPANTYHVRSKLWQYPGMSGWYFLTIPKKTSETIKTAFGTTAKGWGSLPVEATIGKTVWHTSIFPDTKAGAYLLPIKKQVRLAERLVMSKQIPFAITIKRTKPV